MKRFDLKRAGKEFMSGVLGIVVIVLVMSISWIAYLAWSGVFK